MKELDVVKLRIDVPELDLHAGDTGTIVHVFDKPSRAYEVEFVNDRGVTRAQLPLQPSQIELIWEAKSG